MANYTVNQTLNASLVEPAHNHFINHSALQILQIVAPQIVLIDRIVSPIWYVLGLFGNPVSAIVWLSGKVRKKNSSAVYFGSLAVVQTIYLVFHIIMELENAWGVNTFHVKHFCEVFNFLLMSPQYLVPMLVLGFTVERYIAVCHPFVKEKYCTVKRAIIVICIMAYVAVSLGLVQIYLWFYHDQIGCVFRPNTENFHEIWTWVTEIVVFGVMPVACLVLNVFVILEIKRINIQSAAMGQGQSASNAASTTTLLSVSFYFICTLIPATIVYAVQTSVTQGDPTLPLSEWSNDRHWSNYFTYLTIRKIVEEICLSNYAAYFVIYYTTGTYFRREVQTLLRIRKLFKRRDISNRALTSDYSLATSNGRTMTETFALDSPSTPC